MLAQYSEAFADYEEDPNSAENIIWLGRRLAYMGKYDEAIERYTEGIEQYPDNPRFYRHRGHRYISIREYEKAITDLEMAASLIEGTPNESEADGMPNARNIPVSTLHGNIYYHLGLAYYLVHNYPKAYEAYLNCRNTAKNPDNLVSSTHWLYMIQRRLDNTVLADSMLNPIETGFDVIENHDYYKLCLLYKGLLTLDSLNINGDSPSSDAVKYGLANWYFYNNDKAKAQTSFEAMMQGSSWTSFGYLAAESDLLKYYSE
jgi:tetratricopeptide (TPR) repeat protein